MADTSALIAVLRREPEADLFERVMGAVGRVLIGAPTGFEFLRVAAATRPGAEENARGLLEQQRIEVVDWTARLADHALDVFLRFGRGRHPAKLNFGDCMTYAVAKSLDAPLLFKGSDFSRADLTPAL